MIPYRAHCNDIDLNKPYRFNDRFEVKAIPEDRWDNINQDINFPKISSGLSREYRSVFGPHFLTRSQMPFCNNEGIRGAVRRLTCVRKPERNGWHERLRDNQFEVENRILS